ncbi:MAG: 50S ribosomal protein L6 [Peptoniphilaceae bacterium]|nr:50S ribosomal protein L6 [Peptoniphilaceae bacterium]MCI6659949.1 50S ribosomal protein L6 [Peptoniphilaceae bacterium]MDD7434393.1 50S ribosomal protein L6 [Peptoniphilaceae bacterium]MDY3076385.1 50S ribosomal protein L6 [Peptoniphilaceae bacterium]MDY3986716.1 50S ribosomal protein L6 [Peptoniphilaceae bacterium]
MSRIGLKPVVLPEKVEVTIDATNKVSVKGPKGDLCEQIDPSFTVSVEDGVLHVARPDDENKSKALHGLYRTLIANMVEGVTNGYSKLMKIDGTGYRAQKQGKNLVMNLGYSHPVTIPDADGCETEVPDERTIIVKGIDKQAVGNFAANIRKWRLPEPYKGKGIHYEGEHIRRKEGKTGK